MTLLHWYQPGVHIAFMRVYDHSMFIRQLYCLNVCFVVINTHYRAYPSFTQRAGKDREMGSSDNIKHVNSGATYTSMVQSMECNMCKACYDVF